MAAFENEKGERRGGAHPSRSDATSRTYDLGAFFWLSSRFSSTVISSPTTTPPVSSALFQVRPKSLRLIVVVAVAPRLVLPHGSLIASAVRVVARVTSLVTPCTVR